MGRPRNYELEDLDRVRSHEELCMFRKMDRASLDSIDSIELMETLADIEHERWSSWMRYMFDNWTCDNVIRWVGQMNAPYSELPEYSKESDRKEVRKTISAIKNQRNKND